MKLRFRNNSLRLRVNQREVQSLASGAALREEIQFPGNTQITYTLQASSGKAPRATFEDGIISISAPGDLVHHWADGEDLGLYFNLPTERSTLAIAIEKDLECLDGPPDERDPEAFPRTSGTVC